MTVIMYSTDCPRCKVLRAKLESKGVDFSEVTDVDQMMALGIQSVPVLSVDGQLMDFVTANTWVNHYNRTGDVNAD